MSPLLATLKAFSAEGAAVGRLLTAYSAVELAMFNCVQMARGGDFDNVLKKMFRPRGETRRINEAEKLGLPDCQRLGLAIEFHKAIRAVRYCLKIRNQYSHWVWWDDHSGKLAFANLEDVAMRKRRVADFSKLKPHHIDSALLGAQEAYFVYTDGLLAWVNYEARHRDGRLSIQPVHKPKPVKRPKLRLS